MSKSVAATVRLPTLAVYPERQDQRRGWIEDAAVWAQGLVAAHWSGQRGARLGHMVWAMNDLADDLRGLDDTALAARREAVATELQKTGLSESAVVTAFALIREYADRTLGLRPYDVQLTGGLAMLGSSVAEMETGEGKTLAATLPAATAALAGFKVHIVTVNDYLAARDRDWMGPLYRSLGLTLGLVNSNVASEDRRANYACDVTYCTNKDLAFDYLRDSLTRQQLRSDLRLKSERLRKPRAAADRLLLQGLQFAIIDEADSVLVDEARTPLIISREVREKNGEEVYRQALSLAETLTPNRDYRILRDMRAVELTGPGRTRLAEVTSDLDGVWPRKPFREELARLALTATLLFHSGEQYIVQDRKVEIVDEYTGRSQPDRSWSEGLHQLIEVKEGCPLTARKVPMARITYQRLFRRYERLAGMTGTAHEVADELWSVYGLKVTRIPANRPTRRRNMGTEIHPTTGRKWERIASQAATHRASGRPVLIGTRSVAASQRASAALTAQELCHEVLNAAQDQEEAAIIEQAGWRGTIIVATNMAGRGTDIRLGDGVAELGGLHVILSERHDAGRIDRQLAGRCARQGEPGSVQTILSMEDPILDHLKGNPLASLLSGFTGNTPLLGLCLFHWAQRKAEASHSRVRRALLKADRRLNDVLAFSGPSE